MNTNTGKGSGDDRAETTLDEQESRASGCCGSENIGSDDGCPFATMLARHRFAAFSFLALATLAILIAEVGGVLGILAFFRTI